MATYGEIATWLQEHYGWPSTESCWIAHVKELHGLPRRPAHNRRGPKRVKPCPPQRQAAIEAAFRALGMLPPEA
jgi:hypothetical protein